MAYYGGAALRRYPAFVQKRTRRSITVFYPDDFETQTLGSKELTSVPMPIRPLQPPHPARLSGVFDYCTLEIRTQYGLSVALSDRATV